MPATTFTSAPTPVSVATQGNIQTKGKTIKYDIYYCIYIINFGPWLATSFLVGCCKRDLMAAMSTQPFLKKNNSNLLDLKEFMEKCEQVSQTNVNTNSTCAAQCAGILSVPQPKKIELNSQDLNEPLVIVCEAYVDYVCLKARNVDFNAFAADNPENLSKRFSFNANSWAKPPKVFGDFPKGHSFHLSTFAEAFDIHIVFEKSGTRQCDHYHDEDHVPPGLVKKIQYVILRALSEMDLSQDHFGFDFDNLMNSPYIKEKAKYWVPLEKLSQLRLNFSQLPDPYFQNHTARLYVSAFGQNNRLPSSLYQYFKLFFI